MDGQERRGVLCCVVLCEVRCTDSEVKCRDVVQVWYVCLGGVVMW